MKVLRSSEWEPVAWIKHFPPMQGPVYVFLDKRYKDVVALKVAKYVDVLQNNVYLYDAEKQRISLRSDDTELTESSVPQYVVLEA